jgi:hypothetical protein
VLAALAPAPAARAQFDGKLDVYVADQVGNRIVRLNGVDGAIEGELLLGPLGVVVPAGLGVGMGAGLIREAVVVDVGVAPPVVNRINLGTGVLMGVFPAPAPGVIGAGSGLSGFATPPKTYLLADGPPTIFEMDPVAGGVLGVCAPAIPDGVLDCAVSAFDGVWVLRAAAGATEIWDVDPVLCVAALLGVYPWAGWGIGAHVDDVGGVPTETLFVSDVRTNCLHAIDPATGAEIGGIDLGRHAPIGPYIRGVGVYESAVPVAAPPPAPACESALVSISSSVLEDGGPPAAFGLPFGDVAGDPSWLRGGPPIAWVPVHPVPGPCAPEDDDGSLPGQTPEDVFCFEAAGGDPTWPLVPGAMWTTGGGNPAGAPAVPNYWHLAFDPKYLNAGNTCEFSDDWMWAARPDIGPIPTDGFSYFLVSPEIPVAGWTGGLIEYAMYRCLPEAREDYVNFIVRTHTAADGWGPWRDTDGYLVNGGCESWSMNRTEDVTPFLGDADALQFAWHMLDVDRPGDPASGLHASVQVLIDNVSIGSFDGSGTYFAARSFDLFSDTFSRTDPAHTPGLGNTEEGDWSGNAGARAFAKEDSLFVDVSDVDGVTAGSVLLYWRVGAGTPPVYGSWLSKPMVYSDPDPASASDEGGYRSAVGNTAGEDYSADEAGSLGDPLKDPIWDAGQTVQYYVEVTDDAMPVPNVATFPGGGESFEFEVLPFHRATDGGQKILIVDDCGRDGLDFAQSTGFDPTGGYGYGTFNSPVYDEPENLLERALALHYGGSEAAPKWDIYDVQGAGTAVQREPRVVSSSADGIGGIADDLGVPTYDAVIWLHGDGVVHTYEAETRLGLALFLAGGGHLLSSGDNVAYALGAGGLDEDAAFLDSFLGVAFPSSSDNRTADPVLNVVSPGTPFTLGLYGACPGVPRAFDKLTLAAPAPGFRENSVIATYQAGDPATNGRAAMIKNVVLNGAAPDGIAVHCGFDLGALVSVGDFPLATRGGGGGSNGPACILQRVLVQDFGLPATGFAGCVNSGTDVPVVEAPRFGFELSEAWPNPFTERTAIRFGVPARSHVRIGVYNVLGQRVKALVDETLAADLHVREWDGSGDGGTRVSSGIYFFRMDAGDFSATRKAVVLH